MQANTAESENLCMRGHSKRENREVSLAFSGKEKAMILATIRSNQMGEKTKVGENKGVRKV